MGLNNTQMAHAIKEKYGMKNHAAFHPKTFYKIEPDIFHGYKKISYFTANFNDTTNILYQPGFQNEHVFRLYKGIFGTSKFKQTYIPVLIKKDDLNIYLKTFISKDFYHRIKDNPNFEIRLI
jgi:hypothetical protein